MKSVGQYSVSVMSSVSSQASVVVRPAATEESSPVRSAALFLVGHLGNSNLALLQPISLVLESDDDGGFVVSDPIFAVYGEGQVPVAALRDYRSSLEDYFYLLKDHSENTPEDAQQFSRLKGYVDFQPRLLEYKGPSLR